MHGGRQALLRNPTPGDIVTSTPRILAALGSALLIACLGSAGSSQAAAFDGQKLDVQGQAALRQIADSALDPQLRYPDFHPYQAEFREFYSRTGSTLGWVRERKPTPQAIAMIGLFNAAADKGLVPEDYDASRWPARLQALAGTTSDGDLANFDAALTVSTMRYVRALHVGRVNPKTLGRKLDVEKRRYDLGEFLYEKLVRTGNPAAVVLSVEPTFPAYLRTLEALRRYRLFARDYLGQPLAVPAKPIAPGGTYVDLPRLTQLLRLVGDLPADAPVSAQSTTYQGAVVDAVKAYQFRHGELPDGHIKPKLINEMNVPMSVRVRQIELALERWRWLEHSFSQPPVLVNLPEFRLRALDDDNHVALVKTVIIGKAFGHKSPVFEKEIKYVVFRPYWEVTPTIQRAEIVPHVEKNRNYIAQKNFEVVTPDGKVVTDGVISDAVLEQLKSGHLRVRQKPGPTNSLGLVKLIFPNEDNVYLHGTEAPQLFGEEVRDLSHGCIRVDKPADLAAWALRHNPGWNLERVQAMMNGTQDNVTVNLQKPIPVLILYGTVLVDEKNNVYFFDDVYGYDKQLDEALKKGYPYPST
jgi:L,D-transpeptidase YcbB